MVGETEQKIAADGEVAPSGGLLACRTGRSVMHRHTVLLAVTATLLVLAACGVPKDEYAAVVSERDSLEEHQHQLEENYGILVEQYDALKVRNQELKAVNNELGESNKMLALRNENLVAANTALEDSGKELELKNESLIAENKELGDKTTELEARNEGLESEIARLQEQGRVLVAQVTDLEASVSNLSGRLESQEAEVSRLEDVLEKAGTELKAVTVERDALQDELTQLRPLVDDEALMLEIEELRQERDQLISAIDRIRAASSELAGSRPAFWSRFMCTGSMEPFIDCGDVGIYLVDPGVGEIEVGDVIDFPSGAFHPACPPWADTLSECRSLLEFMCVFPLFIDGGTYTVHRVVAKTVVDGVTYYQTKGDANVEVDFCQVPYPRVKGKLIRVLVDVRPEDVIDTTEYDAALERYRGLQRKYNELKAVYDERKAYYEAVQKGYESGDYSYGSYYAAWESLEEARLELNEVVPLLNEAIDELERIKAETFGE